MSIPYVNLIYLNTFCQDKISNHYARVTISMNYVQKSFNILIIFMWRYKFQYITSIKISIHVRIKFQHIISTLPFCLFSLPLPLPQEGNLPLLLTARFLFTRIFKIHLSVNCVSCEDNKYPCFGICPYYSFIEQFYRNCEFL